MRTAGPVRATWLPTYCIPLASSAFANHVRAHAATTRRCGGRFLRSSGELPFGCTAQSANQDLGWAVLSSRHATLPDLIMSTSRSAGHEQALEHLGLEGARGLGPRRPSPLGIRTPLSTRDRTAHGGSARRTRARRIPWRRSTADLRACRGGRSSRSARMPAAAPRPARSSCVPTARAPAPQRPPSRPGAVFPCQQPAFPRNAPLPNHEPRRLRACVRVCAPPRARDDVSSSPAPSEDRAAGGGDLLPPGGTALPEPRPRCAKLLGRTSKKIHPAAADAPPRGPPHPPSILRRLEASCASRLLLARAMVVPPVLLRVALARSPRSTGSEDRNARSYSIKILRGQGAIAIARTCVRRVPVDGDAWRRPTPRFPARSRGSHAIGRRGGHWEKSAR